MVEQNTVETSEQRLNQFRADFALVWRTWRANGEITEQEMQDGMKEAGMAVKANLKDPEWMTNASAHFASMAAAIRHDQQRAERIAAEVRAEQMRRAA